MTSKVDPKVRAARAKKTGEIFTPDRLVNQMLSKLPKEVWRKGKTFCDPACGSGQFLIWVLILKIRRGHNPLDALKTIYGVDIMRDNIRECRVRLLKLVSLWEDITSEHIEAVLKNIVWINPDKFPGGSLQYDFSFDNNPKKEEIDRWIKHVHEDHILDDVDLPVSEERFKSTNKNLFGEDIFEVE